jgi:hypothetical protein
MKYSGHLKPLLNIIKTIFGAFITKTAPRVSIMSVSILIIAKVTTMPIKPENRHRYPARKEWLKIRATILDRANNQCEFCAVENYSIRGTTKIVLTIAHLDQHPENNAPNNLAALCQRCHLNHDRPFHIVNRKRTFF